MTAGDDDFGSVDTGLAGSDVEAKRRDEIGTWLRKELSRTGKTQGELAKYLGLQQSQVSRLLHGTRGLDVIELEKIEQFLGGSGLRGVPVLGAVGLAVWQETRDLSEIGSVSALSGSRVPIEHQFAVRVDRSEGNLEKGDLLFAYGRRNVKLLRSKLRQGDMVVMRRHRGRDLSQLSICLTTDGDSGDNKLSYRPLLGQGSPADSEEVIGIVFALVRPIRWLQT